MEIRNCCAELELRESLGGSWLLVGLLDASLMETSVLCLEAI